jgi:hypothetical protein
LKATTTAETRLFEIESFCHTYAPSRWKIDIIGARSALPSKMGLELLRSTSVSAVGRITSAFANFIPTSMPRQINDLKARLKSFNINPWDKY